MSFPNARRVPRRAFTLIEPVVKHVSRRVRVYTHQCASQFRRSGLALTKPHRPGTRCPTAQGGRGAHPTTPSPVAELASRRSGTPCLTIEGGRGAHPTTPHVAELARVQTAAGHHYQRRLKSCDSSYDARRGFTLIELLMVIVVIGILVGLLSLAVGQALSRAKVTRVKIELDQLATAMDRFSTDYGAYPPNTKNFCFFGTQAQREKRIERFIRKAFPRWTGDYTALQTQLEDATESPGLPAGNPPKANIDDWDQAEILVFFLGGIPLRRLNTSGEVGFELTGFSADPQNPFRHSDTNISASAVTQRTTTYFEFDVRRLVDRDNDGWPEYVPQGAALTGEMPPFVYFGAQSYKDLPFYPGPGQNNALGPDKFPEWGLCVPYLARFDFSKITDPPADWDWDHVNPKSCQIVAAGVDSQYGFNDPPSLADAANSLRVFPTGENYSDFDNDNLTNFTEGPLEDAKP